jgi:hypothetical protein
MRNHWFGIFASAATLLATPVLAAETVTYTYDGKGRLIKVEHSGTVNNGIKYEYSHDRANNRRNLKVTGSPNPAP